MCELLRVVETIVETENYFNCTKTLKRVTEMGFNLFWLHTLNYGTIGNRFLPIYRMIHYIV